MKNIKGILYLIFILLVFSSIVVACSNNDTVGSGGESDTSTGDPTGENNNSEPVEGGDLILAGTAGPNTFNSYYTTQGSDSAMAGLMFDSLNDIDEEGQPVPQLAEDWDISEDGLEITFHLREDVEWHDGKPFTADDVVFTYNIPLSDEYTGPRGSYFSSIDKVEALDEYTVKLTMNEANAQLFVRTTVYPILPKHLLEEVPISELDRHEFNTKNPIGTGPFKFEEWKQGQYVKFVANENYYKGRPYLDSITRKEVPDSNAMLAQFKAGEIDMLGVSSEDIPEARAMEEEGTATLLSSPSASYNMIQYNLKNPLFEDKKVRQALTHALNREEMVEVVLNGNGEVAHSPGIPFLWAFNEDVPKFEYDPEKAKQLLAEAGWSETNDEGILIDDEGNAFSFTLLATPSNETRKQMAEISQQQWKEIGVDMKIQLVEANALLEEIGPPDRDFDATLLGWSVALDPSVTLFFHSDEAELGNNRGSYSNPELDKLMEESDQTLDQEKRKELIDEILEIIAEDQPYTFLNYSETYQIYSPKLRDVKLHPSSSYYEIEEWWMED